MDVGTVNGITDADWTAMAVLQQVETGFDANNRPTTARFIAGGATHSLTQTSYDALGRPECVAQRMNPAAFSSLPASACTLGTEGSFGPDRIARNVYDAAGQIVQGRVAVGTGDEAAEATVSYTSNGFPRYLIDGNGNRAEFRYDGHDRLTRWVWQGSSCIGQRQRIMERVASWKCWLTSAQAR